jgi:hypothetical protein
MTTSPMKIYRLPYLLRSSIVIWAQGWPVWRAAFNKLYGGNDILYALCVWTWRLIGWRINALAPLLKLMERSDSVICIKTHLQVFFMVAIHILRAYPTEIKKGKWSKFIMGQSSLCLTFSFPEDLNVIVTTYMSYYAMYCSYQIRDFWWR